jgi:hypothetical protein
MPAGAAREAAQLELIRIQGFLGNGTPTKQEIQKAWQYLGKS